MTGLRRAIKYMVVTGIIFGIEILLLYIFTDRVGYHYTISAFLAFICTITLGYIINRIFVFGDSKQSKTVGFIKYALISFVGVGIVVGGMVLLVEFFGFNYIHARLIVVVFTFGWTYLMNLYINFKV